MEIVKVELNLKAINKSIALFNCDKKVSGLIHTTENGETTVVLDGVMFLTRSTVRTALSRLSACWP